MTAELAVLLQRVDLLAVVDIVAVTLIIYLLLVLIQGTRADQILIGIVFIALLDILASYLQLRVLQWLLQYAVPALVVAIPIIFQPELRRLLEQLGRTSTIIQRPLTVLGTTPASNPLHTIEQICEATIRLSERRYGGLMAIERQTGLNDFIARGEPLDAAVNASLLLNIFFTNAPLHDGAVIIRGDRIMAAHCLFPLSDEVSESEQFGTRHRAALGISQETDALAIVVSEENGTISVALNGQLIRNLDEPRLRAILVNALVGHGSGGEVSNGEVAPRNKSKDTSPTSQKFWRGLTASWRSRGKEKPADQRAT